MTPQQKDRLTKEKQTSLLTCMYTCYVYMREIYIYIGNTQGKISDSDDLEIRLKYHLF